MTPTDALIEKMARDEIRKAYRARWNKLNRALNEISKYRTTDPDAFDGVIIADMRSAVEDITQCFHEFNAYWNCAAKLGPRARAAYSAEHEEDGK